MLICCSDGDRKSFGVAREKKSRERKEQLGFVSWIIMERTGWSLNGQERPAFEHYLGSIGVNLLVVSWLVNHIS